MQVTIAIVVAIGLMLLAPVSGRESPALGAPGARGAPADRRVRCEVGAPERRTRALRLASLSLIGVMSVGERDIGRPPHRRPGAGAGIPNPPQLLLTGGTIWLTNVIVFGLWYWEFDRGGVVERAAGSKPYPDFVFPQMTSPELAPPDWEPGFVDYLYMSFTNAMAFSPTDVMPMTRWAKLTMLSQSIVSVVTVVLVIARAVNILR